MKWLDPLVTFVGRAENEDVTVRGVLNAIPIVPGECPIFTVTVLVHYCFALIQRKFKECTPYRFVLLTSQPRRFTPRVHCTDLTIATMHIIRVCRCALVTQTELLWASLVRESQEVTTTRSCGSPLVRAALDTTKSVAEGKKSSFLVL